jgi:hypothetical protein
MKLLIVAAIVYAVCAPMALARTWTDSSGKHTVEAEFVDLKDGKVRIKKESGEIITVPVEKLSEPDQEFVERHRMPSDEKALANDGQRKPTDSHSSGEPKVIERLLTQVKDVLFLQPGKSSGNALSDEALALWKTKADMRTKPLVEEIQHRHIEALVVSDLVRLIEEEAASKSMTQEDRKRVCFQAANALRLLASTSPEAMKALKQLQRHSDPTVSSQAMIQLEVLMRAKSAQGSNLNQQTEETAGVITISRDEDNLVFKYNVHDALELKLGEWPALFVFLSRARGPVLSETISRAKDIRRGVAEQAVITREAQVSFWQIAARGSPGLAGYRLGIYDTDKKKIRKGAILTIPFNMFDTLYEPGTATPSLDWKWLGPEATISAALVVFRTEKGNFVFQRFVSQVTSQRVKFKDGGGKGH